nr:MAG TPA: hypothetical protein [Caudoviricetes sp.]
MEAKKFLHSQLPILPWIPLKLKNFLKKGIDIFYHMLYNSIIKVKANKPKPKKLDI